jgi:hypothetical protein
LSHIINFKSAFIPGFSWGSEDAIKNEKIAGEDLKCLRVDGEGGKRGKVRRGRNGVS